MKNKIFTLVLALTCLAEISVYAETVSMDELSVLAGKFFSKNVMPTAVKAKKAKMVAVDASADANYICVIPNEDGEGWIMMATNDVVQPILAYSETGSFPTSEDMPENLKSWLGSYNKQIKATVESGEEASDEVTAQWKALRSGARKAASSTVGVKPLLTTKWQQSKPYNDLCPGSGNTKALAGCVATAMAQIMNYWEWPVTGVGSKSYTPPITPVTQIDYGQQSVDFAHTTFDWSNMLDAYDAYDENSYTEAQARAVATLMYSCGVSVEMMYGTFQDDGSAALSYDAMFSFVNYFKYDSTTINYYWRDYSDEQNSWSDADWIAMLKEELINKRPILYRGTGVSAGHAFVCDGYRSDDYFHFNWGWGGSADGYYNINNLNPIKNDFSILHGVVVGIVPNVTEIYSVTYNAGSHTTCVATSWKQNTIGESCILPDATAEKGYVFLGWSDSPTSKKANVGRPGESYTPRRNVTLYAVTQKIGRLVYFNTNTYNANGTQPHWTNHGSCDVDSLYEDGTGAGITLPVVESDPGWIFKGWYISTSGGFSYVGKHNPNQPYYPNSDKTILYAFWTDTEAELYYIGMHGVIKTSGPEMGWFDRTNDYIATFKAEDGYEALTVDNTEIYVALDDNEQLYDCASFSDGVLTISVSKEQLNRMKQYLVLILNATKMGSHPNPEENITVRLYPDSEWPAVYLYSWAEKDGNIVQVSGEWPGTKVSKDDKGWWTYTFPDDIKNVNIIWGNGGSGLSQTIDITNVNRSTCYKLDGTIFEKANVAVIDCETPVIDPDAIVPTPDDLSRAGYDLANNVVLCLKFTEEATVCYDIVLAGSYNNWNTNPADMLKMQLLNGFKGWYVVEFPYTFSTNEKQEPIYPQAKPVQLKSDGSFSWECQSGDVNAWTQKGEKGAYVVSGVDNEADVYYPEAGAYIYEISYWKNHAKACDIIPKHNYTIMLYAPDACEEMKPAIIGGFNNWSENIPMMAKTDDKSKTYYTYTLYTEEGTEYKFREVNDNTWENQIQQYSTTDTEWKNLTNLALPAANEEDVAVVCDFSDNTQYRFTQCTANDASGIDNTLTPTDTPRKVLENGVLYILRGEKVYTIQGQIVK